MKKLFYFFLAAILFVACEPKDPSTGGAIKDVKINKQVLELVEGGQQRLSLTVTPEGAAYTAIWSSADEKVASVTNKGVVTANAVGETTINVAIEGTDLKASCSVIVKSALDATVYDCVLMNGQPSDPFDVTLTLQSGKDTTLKVVTANFLMIPSTMYLSGNSLLGEPGYCVNILTSFEVGIDPETGEPNAYYALADYSIVDNAVTEKGYFIPYAIQTSKFDAKNYGEYYTNLILFNNEAIDEKPNVQDYPYYGAKDSYMFRGVSTDDGIGFADGGSIVIAEGNESGIIQLRQNDKGLCPSYYNFDASLLSTEGDFFGFALTDSINPETGELVGRYYMDNDGDDIFDLAPMVDYTFVGGEYDDPSQEVSVAEYNLYNAQAIPAAQFEKRAAVISTLNVPFMMKVRVK